MLCNRETVTKGDEQLLFHINDCLFYRYGSYMIEEPRVALVPVF